MCEISRLLNRPVQSNLYKRFIFVTKEIREVTTDIHLEFGLNFLVNSTNCDFKQWPTKKIGAQTFQISDETVLPT